MSPSKSPSKECLVNSSDIIELRKKFCIGFDLKNKFNRESTHLNGNKQK